MQFNWIGNIYLLTAYTTYLVRNNRDRLLTELESKSDIGFPMKDGDAETGN